MIQLSDIFSGLKRVAATLAGHAPAKRLGLRLETQ